ncbi:MAG: GGDEF domain-containing protein, partial [Acidobacteriota bacterium]
SKLIAETSLAVENALLSRKKEELIIKDDLTKAYNRRFFESYFDEEIRRSQRYSLLLSLIFMDLNDFKRINILYGHFVGSQVLQEVARRIIDKVRNIDKVVRYGGDEFCIVLPETGPQEAYLVAERIREEIENKPYECSESKYYSLTGSYGIASFPEHGSTKRELVDSADKAMFVAKDPNQKSIIISKRTKG